MASVEDSLEMRMAQSGRVFFANCLRHFRWLWLVVDVFIEAL